MTSHHVWLRVVADHGDVNEKQKERLYAAADKIERMETVLKQIAGDNHLTLTEHQLMAKWALEESA